MARTPHAVDDILGTVGRTPLVRLERLELPGGARLYAKCEYLGPGGSIFDRSAAALVRSAELGAHLEGAARLFTAGGGDPVLSLALVATTRGHPLTAVIPRGLHAERRRALLDFGVELVPVDDTLTFDEAQQRAMALASQRRSLFASLWRGREVVAAYEAIGAELREALDAAPTLTVCGLDLGAVPTGIARGLGGAPVLAVEPASARISSGSFGPHLLGGLAPGPDPVALDRSLVTQFEAVDDAEAWALAGRLSRETGLLAGIASGAILVAARRAAARLGSGTVVAVLPDSGERRFMLAPFFEAASA
jgi:cysteine synthase